MPGKGELSLAPTASRLIAVEVEPDLKKMRLLDRFSKVGFTSALSVFVEEEEELLLLLSVTMASFSFSFPLWLSAPSCFSLPPCFSSQRRCSMRSMTSALAAGDDSGSKGGSSLWRGAARRGVSAVISTRRMEGLMGYGVVRREPYLTSFCKTSQSVTICVMSPA